MILITGTPRTGTTFLLQLYHEMKFNTGFHAKFHELIQRDTHTSHGGLEYIRDNRTQQRGKQLKNLEIIKHPWTTHEKSPWEHRIINNIEFEHVIVTNRDYKESSISEEIRIRLKGFAKSQGKEEEAARLKHYPYANAAIRKHWPDHIEVDFPRSVRDRDYLYGQLKPTFDTRVSKMGFNAAHEKIAKREYVRNSP